jgi:hypothetical protein
MFAGNDYVDNFFGITAERIFDSLRRYSNYIGDVVYIDSKSEQGITINGAALVRLIKGAYIIFKELSVTKKDGTTTLYNPADISIANIRAKTSSSKTYRFPERDEFIARSYQVAKYIKELQQLGNDVITESDPLRYGYKLIDPKKGLIRSNVLRVKELKK